MADTTQVRYYQDSEQKHGPYLIEFKTEDEALAFIESIGTGEVVAPETIPAADSTPAPLADAPAGTEGDSTAPAESTPTQA